MPRSTRYLKWLLPGLGLVLILVISAVVWFKPAPLLTLLNLSGEKTTQANPSGTKLPADLNELLEYELVAEREGENALALLRSQVPVQVEEYEFGSFIKSINGISGNNDYFWAFYLNDAFATQAADRTILKPGDRVKFIFQAVSEMPNKELDPSLTPTTHSAQTVSAAPTVTPADATHSANQPSLATPTQVVTPTESTSVNSETR